MPGPPVEVADVIRAAGESFFENSRKWLTWLHLKVLNAILRCRTAALGGHADACSKCGHGAISFNSCRNRHCPKCQANARDRWLEARGKELLPTRYVCVLKIDDVLAVYLHLDGAVADGWHHRHLDAVRDIRQA